MTDAPAPSIVIGEFPLNSRDRVRVALDVFNGRPVIALRKWFLPEGADAPRPTPKGLTIALRHLPALAALANDALARAIADGLIEPEGGED